jgi:hypothetical protein
MRLFSLLYTKRSIFDVPIFNEITKTREKCTGRLRMSFDFICIFPGETMIERSKDFCDRSKSNNGWAFSCIVQYLQTLKRVETKEISAGTMKDRYQDVRLFCDMADIPV